MNSTPPKAKSQACGPTISTCPSLVIDKLVHLKHEEIATNATQYAATSAMKFAFRLQNIYLSSIYICNKRLIFPPADVFVYLDSTQ